MNKWIQIPLGPLQTNAYVIYNEEKEAIIIDPGGDGEKLVNWLNNEEIKPIAILLTHAHFDHIGAVDELRDHTNIPVYVHIQEKDWLSDPEKNGSSFFLGNRSVRINDADYFIKEEGRLEIGAFTFEVFETPGHSPGSVSYYMNQEGIVFSGDVLFAGGIGRTDLPGGNHSTLMTSISGKLMELPEETVVASGHGPTTTIAVEMDSNPFLMF